MAYAILIMCLFNAFKTCLFTSLMQILTFDMSVIKGKSKYTY